MKRYLRALLLASVVFAIASCNPDPAEPEPDPSVSPLPSGVMQVDRLVYDLFSSGPDTTDNVLAYFTTTPGGSTESAINAGTVLYNTSTLYADTTNADSLAWIYGIGSSGGGALMPTNVPSIWTVTGSAAVPAFTYTHAGTRPDIIAPLPDMLYKSAGWAVSFPAFISGADSVDIILMGNTEIQKGAPVSAGSITFSPAELQSLGASFVVMQITGHSFANEVIGGKRYWFTKNLVVLQYVELSD